MEESNFFEFIKDWASPTLLVLVISTTIAGYFSGAFSKGMEIDQVTQVTGLELRDYLLEMKESESRD